MAGIGSRIEGWVEAVSERWKDRLAGWLADVALKGATKVLDTVEDATRDEAVVPLSKLKQIPDLPAEFHEAIDRASGKAMPQALVAIMPYLIGMMFGLAIGSARPVANYGSYMIDKIVKSYRLDPVSVVTAWRRDPKTYEKLFADLKDQGWSEERIEALKFYTLAFPGIQDIIRFAVREVYSPEIAERFGQFEDFPTKAVPDAEKVGLTEDILKNYWAAHWDLPSASQGFEMLHRGIIDEDTLKMLLRALDVMPYWRDKLVDISWNVPTRVDIRRFYDLGVIDDNRLRELYTAFGYHGTDLDNICEFTRRYVNREKTVADKELTKSEIIKGVKKELISYDQGVELLRDLDYSEETADFVLAINLTVAAGSPETFEEFKDLTGKWRTSMGMEAKPVPEELKAAAREVVRLTGEAKSLGEAVKAEEARLIPGEALPAEVTAKLDELKASLARANTALAAAKTHYDSLLAQWRHG